MEAKPTQRGMKRIDWYKARRGEGKIQLRIKTAGDQDTQSVGETITAAVARLGGDPYRRVLFEMTCAPMATPAANTRPTVAAVRHQDQIEVEVELDPVPSTAFSSSAGAEEAAERAGAHGGSNASRRLRPTRWMRDGRWNGSAGERYTSEVGESGRGAVVGC